MILAGRIIFIIKDCIGYHIDFSYQLTGVLVLSKPLGTALSRISVNG